MEESYTDNLSTIELHSAMAVKSNEDGGVKRAEAERAVAMANANRQNRTRLDRPLEVHNTPAFGPGTYWPWGKNLEESAANDPALVVAWGKPQEEEPEIVWN